MEHDVLLGALIVVLAYFVGLEIARRVPFVIQAPLLAATTAVHGSVLVGALVVLGRADRPWLQAVGMVAVTLASANLVGGLTLAQRMLAAFRTRYGTIAPAADAERDR